LKIAFRPTQCPFCSSVSVVKIGLRQLKNKKVQRFLCKDCGRKFQLDRVRSKYCKPSGCLLALIQRLKQINLENPDLAIALKNSIQQTRSLLKRTESWLIALRSKMLQGEEKDVYEVLEQQYNRDKKHLRELNQEMKRISKKKEGYTSRQISWFFKLGLNKSVSHAFINNLSLGSFQACGHCVFCKVKPEHVHCFMWNIWNKSKEKNSCLACGSYNVQLVESMKSPEKFRSLLLKWSTHHVGLRWFKDYAKKQKQSKQQASAYLEKIDLRSKGSTELRAILKKERKKILQNKERLYADLNSLYKDAQQHHNNKKLYLDNQRKQICKAFIASKKLALLHCKTCGRIARLNNYSKDCTDLWSPEKYQSWLIKQLSSEQELVSGLRSWFSTELTEV